MREHAIATIDGKGKIQVQRRGTPVDLSQLHPFLALIGVVAGLLVGLLALLTGLVNLKKAKYEALKAGVPQEQRGRVWRRLAYTSGILTFLLAVGAGSWLWWSTAAPRPIKSASAANTEKSTNGSKGKPSSAEPKVAISQPSTPQTLGKPLGEEQHIQVPEGYALPIFELRGVVSRYRALSGRFEIRTGMDNSNVVKDCNTPEWTSHGQGVSVVLVSCGGKAEVGVQQIEPQSVERMSVEWLKRYTVPTPEGKTTHFRVLSGSVRFANPGEEASQKDCEGHAWSYRSSRAGESVVMAPCESSVVTVRSE
jgi:hypothetical protein